MSTRKPKSEFTPADQRALGRFFARNPLLLKTAPSTYAKFAAQREGQTHSTESWRGYYQKTGTKLVDRWVRRYEEKYKQQGKGLPDTDDESTDSDEDPSDFNTEDEGLLLAQLVKGKINQRDANSTFEKLAILTPDRHSRKGWKARYKQEAKVIEPIVNQRYQKHLDIKRKAKREREDKDKVVDEGKKAKRAKRDHILVEDTQSDVVVEDESGGAAEGSRKKKSSGETIPKVALDGDVFSRDEDEVLVSKLVKGQLKHWSLDNILLHLSQTHEGHSQQQWRDRYERYQTQFDAEVATEVAKQRPKQLPAAAPAVTPAVAPAAVAKYPDHPLLVEPDTEDDSLPKLQAELSQINDSPPTPNPTPPRINSQDAAAPVLPLPSHFSTIRPADTTSTNLAPAQPVASTSTAIATIKDQLELPSASQATSISVDSVLPDEDDRRIEASLSSNRNEVELTESQKADFDIYGEFDLAHPDLQPRNPPIPRPLPPLKAGMLEEMEAIQRENVVAKAAWTIDEADRIRDVKQELARAHKIAEAEERARLAARKQEREKELAEEKLRRANEKREKAVAEAERISAEQKSVEAEAEKRAVESAEAIATTERAELEIARKEIAELRAQLQEVRRSSSVVQEGARVAEEGNPARGSKRPRASGLAMERSLTPAPVVAPPRLASPIPPPVASTSQAEERPKRKEKKRQREPSPPLQVEPTSPAPRSVVSPAKKVRVVAPAPTTARASLGKSPHVPLSTILKQYAKEYNITVKNVSSLFFSCNALDDFGLLTDALDFYCQRTEEGTPRHAQVADRMTREVWSWVEDCALLSDKAATQHLIARKGKSAVAKRRSVLAASNKTRVEDLVRDWPWTGWADAEVVV